ncbi:MAG TPA: cytochrome b/b6 domain-containing protein [Aquaticitalea sp.]|nr:cytochrome b/b6 domain-containing protein [Aquaticitalea sp.]
MTTKNQDRFTVIHRALHWSIAILMLILFITGFLRMYWMNKNHIVSIIENETQQVPLSKEQMVGIATSIREPMWQWHDYAAYIVLFIFLTKVIYMIVKGIKFPNPFLKNQSTKERLQGFTYLLFYLFIAVSIITGFYLKWIDGDWKEPMEAVHKWAIYWFPIFILLHFSGILLGELTDKKGIASKMIGGDR